MGILDVWDFCNRVGRVHRVRDETTEEMWDKRMPSAIRAKETFTFRGHSDAVVLSAPLTPHSHADGSELSK